MEVDIGNALSSVATPGVPRTSLEHLDEAVASAHERIERGRTNGDHGYAALNLPSTTDPDDIKTTVDPFVGADALLIVGIGGSALGAATIANALESDVDTYVLDNVDPERTTELLAKLPLETTAVNVVSRSGTTAETLANFLVVREAFERASVDWTERTLVTTGDSGPLRALADKHALPALDVPAGVPGRFSALSTVGLAAAAIRGDDVEALLAGGQDVADDLTGSLFETPPYAYGAITHALANRGATINAMMPYDERLETYAEWFAQLWAESLGKGGSGQTPVRALGATDQHSQLQLYRAGPRNAMVTFVSPQERANRPIPATDIDGLGYLGDATLDELLTAELEATEGSLAAAGRPNVRIELDRVDERGLGQLLYGMEAACVLAGELRGVDTFVQPAVEWGKRATRGLLGADGAFDEARAVEDKERLVVR